jgi:phospholipid/cholesterol/gamma-HCH transport system permease protein
VSVYERIESTAGIGRLLVLTVRAIFRSPFIWLGDALAETAGTIRRCVVPLTLSSATFGVGLAVVYFGGVVKLLGTEDRLGGAMEAGFTREPEAWVAMMIIAGAAGSAITADLGARKIREELDDAPRIDAEAAIAEARAMLVGTARPTRESSA